MIILSGNCPRHHNAIMLELTDFDDSKISYLARISRGHPNLSIEDLFRVLDNIVEIPQFNVGQTTTIRRDNSGWRPYDTGTFISYASNGITLSDEGTCK